MANYFSYFLFCCQYYEIICSSLTDLVQSREQLIKDMAKYAEQLYASKCDLPTRECDECTYNTCSYDQPKMDCIFNSTSIHCPFEPYLNEDNETEYPCRLMYTNASMIKIPISLSASQEDVKEVACTYKNMDPNFIENLSNDKSILSQFVVSSNGVYRTYPGQDMCQDFNPTTETWFIGAQSGPKNIIPIIDRSGSMNTDNRIGMAKEALKAIFGTLNSIDHAQIVLFNSGMFYYTPTNQTTGNEHLFRWEGSVIQETLDFIESIPAGGGTKYLSGFQAAKKIFENSEQQGFLNDCQNVVLFLTDGTGDITGLFEELKAFKKWKTTIFTYTVGGGVSDEFKAVLRRVACEYKGIYTPINDVQDLSKIMSSYFKFISKGTKVEQVVWTQPYYEPNYRQDVVVGSYPIYDYNTDPNKFVGVAAIMVKYSDFIAATLNNDPNEVSNELKMRSSKCYVYNLSECQLEAIRYPEICGTCPQGLQDAITKFEPIPCQQPINKTSVFCGPTGNVTNTLQTMRNMSHCCNSKTCLPPPIPQCQRTDYYFSLILAPVIVLCFILCCCTYGVIKWKFRENREKYIRKKARYYQSHNKNFIQFF